MKCLALVTAGLLCAAVPAWAGGNYDKPPSSPIVRGGTGGTSNAAAHSLASASAISGSAATSNTSVSVSGGGGSGNVDARSAPSIATMAPAAGGQCGVVGFGLGATGMTGGGIISGSWESPNCAARINAQLLAEWGYKPQAVALLRSTFSNVDDAFKTAPVAAAAPQPSDSGAAFDLCAARPGWTGTQLAARYPECRH